MSGVPSDSASAVSLDSVKLKTAARAGRAFAKLNNPNLIYGDRKDALVELARTQYIFSDEERVGVYRHMSAEASKRECVRHPNPRAQDHRLWLAANFHAAPAASRADAAHALDAFITPPPHSSLHAKEQLAVANTLARNLWLNHDVNLIKALVLLSNALENRAIAPTLRKTLLTAPTAPSLNSEGAAAGRRLALSHADASPTVHA